MQKRSGVDVEIAEDPPVRVGVLLQHDLDVLEVVGQARRLDLARLVDEVALGDQHEAVVAPEVGEHRGDVVEQAHRLGEHAHAEVEHARRSRRRHPCPRRP